MSRGSAVASFAMTAGLLALAFMALMQLALAQHARSILTDCAAAGARHGALAGHAPADGAARARELAREALPGVRLIRAGASRLDVAGYAAVRVEVVASLPLLGAISGAQLKGTGRALAEDG